MQVKGLMPQESGIARKHPPAEPLGEMECVKLFLLFQNMLCFGTVLSGLPCNRKSRMSPWQLSPIEYSRFCFLFRYYEDAYLNGTHPYRDMVVLFFWINRFI